MKMEEAAKGTKIRSVVMAESYQSVSFPILTGNQDKKLSTYVVTFYIFFSINIFRVVGYNDDDPSRNRE